MHGETIMLDYSYRVNIPWPADLDCGEHLWCLSRQYCSETDFQEELHYQIVLLDIKTKHFLVARYRISHAKYYVQFLNL